MTTINANAGAGRLLEAARLFKTAEVLLGDAAFEVRLAGAQDWQSPAAALFHEWLDDLLRAAWLAQGDASQLAAAAASG